LIALYIFIAIILLLIIISLLRVGIIVVYSESGFVADAIIGFVKIRAFPREKKEKPKKEKKQPKAKKTEPEPEEKKGGRFADFKLMWPYIKSALERLKRKLRVDELTIYFAAGGSDPASVAMSYGGVTAAMGMIIPVLEQNLNILNRDFETSFSFELKEPYIFIRANITAAVWELIYIGLPLFSMYMKTRERKSRKEEK